MAYRRLGGWFGGGGQQLGPVGRTGAGEATTLLSLAPWEACEGRHVCLGLRMCVKVLMGMCAYG